MNIFSLIIENLGLVLSIGLSFVVLIYATQSIEGFMNFSYPAFIPSSIIQFALGIVAPIFICYFLQTDKDSFSYLYNLFKSLFCVNITENSFMFLFKYVLTLFVILYNWGIYLAVNWYEALYEKGELLANIVSIYLFAVVALVVAVFIIIVLPVMLVIGIIVGAFMPVVNYFKSFNMNKKLSKA